MVGGIFGVVFLITVITFIAVVMYKTRDPYKNDMQDTKVIIQDNYGFEAAADGETQRDKMTVIPQQVVVEQTHSKF